MLFESTSPRESCVALSATFAERKATIKGDYGGLLYLSVYMLRRLILILLACVAAQSLAAQSSAQEAPQAESGPVNVEVSTMGGVQFWSDELLFHDWRIQRHAWTKHCRLLDGKDVRRAWGTFEQCQTVLEEQKRAAEAPPMEGKVVLLLHGLCRSRGSMDPIAKHIAANSDYRCFPVSYASSRGEVADHAKALASIVDHLGDVKEINFVGHSLGNLVVRHYFADLAAAGKKPDPRIKRVVMLTPPNQGSDLAEVFKKNMIFKVVWGRSGRQIAAWEELQPKLATPPCEFAVIAGGGGEAGLTNPLLAGNDDGVVKVSETQLPGAADFLLVPCYHGLILKHDKAKKCVLSFLQHGYLVSAESCSPIPRKAAADDQ